MIKITWQETISPARGQVAHSYAQQQRLDATWEELDVFFFVIFFNLGCFKWIRNSYQRLLDAFHLCSIFLMRFERSPEEELAFIFNALKILGKAKGDAYLTAFFFLFFSSNTTFFLTTV